MPFPGGDPGFTGMAHQDYGRFIVPGWTIRNKGRKKDCIISASPISSKMAIAEVHDKLTCPF
jgi:hypothetical protein